jgi:hypothetical protein
VRVKPLEVDEREEYLALMREVWGDGALSAEEFAWWLDRNPAGPSIVSVAREDGLLGTAAHSLFRWRLAGEERLVSYSLHAAIAEAARGRSLFATLEAENQERARAAGAAAALSFPNAAPSFRLAGDEARAYGAVKVVPLTRFGAATDEAYERVAAAWPNHLVRREAHMNWRFVDSPWGYRAFASITAGEVSGWAIVRVKEHAGAALAVLADLVAPGFAEARALVRRCLAEVATADAMAVLPPRDRAQRRALLSLGFLPGPLSVDFIARPLAEDVTISHDPADWHVALGDTDFF